MNLEQAMEALGRGEAVAILPPGFEPMRVRSIVESTWGSKPIWFVMMHDEGNRDIFVRDWVLAEDQGWSFTIISEV